MSEKKYIATCPACDYKYPVEYEQFDISCPLCHWVIDWELDRHWIKENGEM